MATKSKRPRRSPRRGPRPVELPLSQPAWGEEPKPGLSPFFLVAVGLFALALVWAFLPSPKAEQAAPAPTGAPASRDLVPPARQAAPPGAAQAPGAKAAATAPIQRADAGQPKQAQPKAAAPAQPSAADADAAAQARAKAMAKAAQAQARAQAQAKAKALAADPPRGVGYRPANAPAPGAKAQAPAAAKPVATPKPQPKPANSFSARAWREEGGVAQLVVFGPRNQRVALVKSEPGPAGWVKLRWDAKLESGAKAPRGLYYLRPSWKDSQTVEEAWVE